MDKYSWIRYLGFSSRSSAEYSKRFYVTTNIKIEEEIYDTIPLIKLLFWYDKNHICRTDLYRAILPGLHQGNFIEDVIGQREWCDIKENGIEVHKKYGTYLYYPNFGKDIYLYHSNGRRSYQGISMHTHPKDWSTDKETTFTYFRELFLSKNEEDTEQSEATEEKIPEEKKDENWNKEKEKGSPKISSQMSVDIIRENKEQHQSIEAGLKIPCPHFLKGSCKFDAVSCSGSHYVYSRSKLFTS